MKATLRFDLTCTWTTGLPGVARAPQVEVSI
jgi:hypothetical protein